MPTGKTLDHLAGFLDTLPEKPILIGHSFGGTLVQLLLDRGYGEVGVVIDSAPVKGVLTLPLSQVKSLFPILKNPANRTCAVAFIDTRTGYVYGVAESTANEELRSDLWNKEEAIEKARAKAERTAFAQALGDVEKLWAQIAARATANRGAGGGAPPASP